MMSRLVLPLPMTPGRALRAGHLVQDLLPPLQVPTLLQRGTIPKIRHQGSLAVVVVAAAAVAVGIAVPSVAPSSLSDMGTLKIILFIAPLVLVGSS